MVPTLPAWRHSSARRCSNASPLSPSTCSSSAGASPAPGSLSTPSTRGLRTALVEADDFASGTSSKSSKLVHGGLRYLQQGDVRLVYEALHERERLRNNAPHLVKLLPFMIPVLTKDGLIPRRVARALGSAMWMYDITGGARIGKFHKRLDADDAFTHLPTMPRERLAGGYLYYDATTDDARLVLTIVRTAAEHGAVVANRCRVVALTKDGAGRVDGATVDAGDGSSTSRRGWSSTPPACGPTSCGRSRTASTRLDPPGQGRAHHRAVGQGAQRHRRRHPRAAVTSAACSSCRGDRARDGTFEHTYVGTTDTDYTGPLDDPPCTADDIAYVLRALNDDRDDGRSRPTTSPACGPGCGHSSSRRRAGAPPTCRGATG